MRARKVGNVTTIILSRRNIESLLAKLNGHPPDSACTLVGGDDAPNIVIRAEENEVHYAYRPAGEIHEDTRSVLENWAYERDDPKHPEF